jgi:hypothetical protein
VCGCVVVGSAVAEGLGYDWRVPWREERFAAVDPGLQNGWLGRTIEPERWKPVKQPQLPEMLKAVPEKPVTSLSQVRRHAYSFRRGPKGYLWCFLGEVLVRIDPRDAQVEVLGRLRPSQLAFVGEDVYAAGSDHLQRVRLISQPDRAVKSQGISPVVQT